LKNPYIDNYNPMIPKKQSFRREVIYWIIIEWLLFCSSDDGDHKAFSSFNHKLHFIIFPDSQDLR